jgi:hypothetical protein
MAGVVLSKFPASPFGLGNGDAGRNGTDHTRFHRLAFDFTRSAANTHFDIFSDDDGAHSLALGVSCASAAY